MRREIAYSPFRGNFSKINYKLIPSSSTADVVSFLFHRARKWGYGQVESHQGATKAKWIAIFPDLDNFHLQSFFLVTRKC